MRALPRRVVAAASVFAAATALAACGKKGPPLPPFVHVPDAVRQFAARRAGGDVVLTVTLPVQNVDGSTPLDLGRVEVYGYTGRTPPPQTRFVASGRLVGTIEPGTEIRSATTLRDVLSDDELVAGTPVGRAGGAGPAHTTPSPSDARAPLKRFYMAIPFSPRGRPGPPSAIVELPLTPIPDAPLDVRATYNAQSASLTWAPSGGILGFLLDRAALPAATPLDDGPPVADAGALPAGPTRYNIYRETEQSAPTAATTAGLTNETPVTSTPVEGFTFNDAIQLDGRRRCYTVTAVRGSGDHAVESRASEPACIVAVDTFPPAPPVGVSPIAVEGEINLVWEANAESDLLGYRVLRGEAGDTLVLSPLNDQPVVETRFTDSSVRPGVRYVYAVQALDRHTPEPNVSAESDRVDVTAR